MKNKDRVTNSLFPLFSKMHREAFWYTAGRFAGRRAIRQTGHLLVAVVVLALLASVSWSRAEETGALLENITFDRQSNARETVSFKLNGPAIPKIFALKGDVPKVVFDFDNTRKAPSIQAVMKSRGNLVSAIRTAMHQDPQLKTRVVLDLVPAGDYDFSQDFNKKDNILVITVFHTQQKKETQQHEQVGGKPMKIESGPAKIVSSHEVVKKEAASAPPPVQEEKVDSAPAIITPRPEAAEKETASVPQPVQEEKVEPAQAKTPPPVAVEKETASAPPPVPEKKVEPSPPPPAPAVAVKKTLVSSPQLVINKISFEKTPDKGEKVSFQLTHFHPPVIFGVEEGTPSIVCDFMDAGVGSKVPENISVKGEFVKQVRVEKNESSHKIRVVLVLVPNRHYDLQQVFFKEESLYVLFVKSQNSTRAGKSGKP